MLKAALALSLVCSLFAIKGTCDVDLCWVEDGANQSEVRVAVIITNHSRALNAFTVCAGGLSQVVKRCHQRLLARPESFVNVSAIPFARVPIVTGTVLVPRGDGGDAARIDFDISVNNTLALHNTDLLRTYAQLDAR